MHCRGLKFKNILFIILALLFALSGCASGQALEGSKETASQVQNIEPSESVSPAPFATSPAPSASPEISHSVKPSAQPAPVEIPDPFFLKEGEEYSSDTEKGLWTYRSATTWVEAKRVFIKDKVQTYYAAEVRLKPGESEIAGFANPKKPGTSNWLPLYEIQRNYKTVIAISGDYMQQKEPDQKGIIIHDGKILLNSKGADTFALYPDGTMRTFKPGEITPEELLASGVKNTYSFGPTLVSDYKLAPNLMKHRVARANPRSAVGMIEPYHFLLVVVDGRQANYSVGMTMQELAEVFVKYGCSVAYNLDGGASATMSFMGKNINKYGGKTTGQRSVKDALMYGVSEKVAQGQD